MCSQMTFGYFSQPIDVQLLDGRLVKLLNAVTYFDPADKQWTAPKGFTSDGASIPQAFWSLVGGPWDGPYRNAAIVHDRYCVSRSEPSPAVHLMFYRACRASGVGKIKSKILYAAVRIGGPRWGDDVLRIPRPGPSTILGMDPLGPTEDAEGEPLATLSAEQLAKWIENDDPSLDEIERLGDTATLVE
jgi:hypothetical protein